MSETDRVRRLTARHISDLFEVPYWLIEGPRPSWLRRRWWYLGIPVRRFKARRAA